MKVWMWQRLYAYSGGYKVHVALSEFDNIDPHDEDMESGWYWLCPKPNLVLVDRKHLGGME